MRISAAASGTFRQRTNAFVRRADSSKSAGSRVRTYSHCPSCRDNAAIRPDYRNAPKASILILTPMPHLAACPGYQYQSVFYHAELTSSRPNDYDVLFVHKWLSLSTFYVKLA